MRVTYSKVSELGQESLLLWLQPALQFVCSMQSEAGNWESIAVLSGAIMNEEAYFRQSLETKNSVLVLVGLILKARIAIFFDQFSLAASIFDNCISIGIDAIEFSHAAAAYYFDQARVHYGLFELLGQRPHLRQARKYQKLLHKMEEGGCPNSASFNVFLVAQEMALKKKSMIDLALQANYDHGIEVLEKSQFVHLEGLLNERAAFDFVSRGEGAIAERYFRRALHVYRYKWGSNAKYKWLSEMCRNALRGVGDSSGRGRDLSQRSELAND